MNYKRIANVMRLKENAIEAFKEGSDPNFVSGCSKQVLLMYKINAMNLEIINELIGIILRQETEIEKLKKRGSK